MGRHGVLEVMSGEGKREMGMGGEDSRDGRVSRCSTCGRSCMGADGGRIDVGAIASQGMRREE